MLTLTRCWIVLSACLCAAGWVLSWIGRLDKTGYGTALVLIVAAFGFWGWRERALAARFPVWLKKSKRRFRRPLPAVFLLLALLTLIGGAIHPVALGDALVYKFPRVLHWLDAREWHWIHTDDPRMNAVGLSLEWLWTPVLLFVKNERILYIFNWISFLLLPGLVYSLLTEMGVSRRVSWYWMWLLPTGYCYAFQAGSVANDAFATVFAIGSVTFALRGWKRERIGDLWVSMLAAGMLTGIKQTNLPLALLWVIAAAPGVKLLLRGWLKTIPVGLIAILSSVAPISYLNHVHSGSWKGFAVGPNLEIQSPVWGIMGNTFTLTVQNLLPPIFPMASKWNDAMHRITQTDLGKHLTGFDRFGFLGRAPAELNAGIGFGICILIGVSIIAGFRHKRGSIPEIGRTEKLLHAGSWVALLAFMAKVGVFENARYLAPYYPFLLASVLRFTGTAELTRQRWWRWSAVMTALLAVALVVTSRQRPIWPAHTVLTMFENQWPNSRVVKAAKRAYTFVGQGGDAYAKLVREIPPTEKVIGYATKAGYNETELWKPFGTRSVRQILAKDDLEWVRRTGLRYVVVDPTVVAESPRGIEGWLERYEAKTVSSSAIRPEPDAPDQTIYLVELKEFK
jgi:hypothetical protein